MVLVVVLAAVWASANLACSGRWRRGWWRWLRAALGVPTWMWSATTWWWLMAVVWVVSRRRLDFFGSGLSMSALDDLRFLSPSFGRTFIGGLALSQLRPIARLAPGSRT